MSEFFEATIKKCPECGRHYASCEGPECDCLDKKPEHENDAEVRCTWCGWSGYMEELKEITSDFFGERYLCPECGSDEIEETEKQFKN